ncbi:MAG: type II toxin-antitoxin system RelE/ParE family toxin [Opitutaceae bacterium]
MIKGFRGAAAESIFLDLPQRRLHPDVARIARRKLVQIDLAVTINDLRVPPANRLEALKGDRKGQHSIRINARWRICFRWTGSDAIDVEIVDYH